MKNQILLFLVSLNIFTALAQVEVKKDSLTQLEQVTIQATRAQKNDPFTKTEVLKTAIESRNLGQDIPILLNFLPNVVTTSDTGSGVGYTGIRVRGSDATRVNVTINGIPLNDSESQATYWVNLPDFASSTQSIQLQRGVGTSTNGAGAFGASLNLKTNNVIEKSGAILQNSYGSFNTHKHNIQFNTGTVANNFSFSGRLSNIQSDGYIDRASSDLNSFFLSGAYQNKGTFIKAMAFGGHEITYQAWNGIDKATFEENPTFNSAGAIYNDAWEVTGYYNNEVDNYTQTHYQLHINQRVNENIKANVAFHYTKGFGFYETYKQNRKFEDYGLQPIDIDGTILDKTDLVRQKWLNNDFYGATYSLKYNNFNNLKVIFGGAVNQYDGDHYGKVIWARYASNTENNHRYYENNGFKTDVNSYLKATYKLSNKFHTYVDMQLRNVIYKTTDFLADDIDVNYLFFNPKVGITYFLNNKSNLYLSYARANKEPIRDDFEYATKTLKPEKLDDLELGWRYTSKTFKVQSNAYFMKYKDQLVLTGALTDVGDFIRANSGESYRLGIELDAAVAITKELNWQPNIALSTNKNIDFYNATTSKFDTTAISYSPNIVAGSNLIYNPLKCIQVAMLSKYVGKQFMNNIELEASELPAYFVTDFQVKWQKDNVLGLQQIAFTGMLNNAFNKKYASNGYMWGETPYYYAQAGTNFLVGLTLKF